MKTKVVYVLVSSPNDYYLEQTWLSAFSLKRVQGDAFISLVVDNKTFDTLKGTRRKILDYVDELKSVSFEDDVSSMRRSRLLKTGLRETIEGDFLYIDGDTIITESLEEIDNFSYSIGAVQACHIPYSDYFAKEELDRMFKKLDFQTSTYYNGGVLYVKDNKEGNLLFSKWHQYYRENMDKVRADMPSLTKANAELDLIHELDGIWNCQILYGMRYLQHAKIIHYFASNFVDSKRDHSFQLMDVNVFKEIKEKGTISEKIVSMIDNVRSLWDNKIEVIGGQELNIYHSRLMKVVRWLYYGHYKSFLRVERLLETAAKRKHNIK